MSLTVGLACSIHHCSRSHKIAARSARTQDSSRPLEILTWDDKIMSVVGHIIEIHIMSVVREATIVGRKGVCSLVFDNVFPAWFDLPILLTDFFSEKKTIFFKTFATIPVKHRCLLHPHFRTDAYLNMCSLGWVIESNRDTLRSVTSVSFKAYYHAFFWVLIDLIIGFLDLIINPFDNQTEIFREIRLIIKPFDRQAF